MKRRTLTIKRSKSGLDVTIPLSIPIVRMLRMARDAHDGKSVYVFPARGPNGHVVRFDSDGLPVYANALRHTYASLAGSLGVDDLIRHMLMAHVPRGVSQKYFVRMTVSSGPAMRAAQRRISADIVRRLGIKLYL